VFAILGSIEDAVENWVSIKAKIFNISIISIVRGKSFFYAFNLGKILTTQKKNDWGIWRIYER
jgi:hypothetical protein